MKRRTFLQLTGLGPPATPLLVAVPGVLASAYLFFQLLAGTVVRIRAPLSNPQRRPDQRFPLMPPVRTAESGTERPTPSGRQRESALGNDGDRADTADTGSDEESPGHTGTRVFSPDEVPAAEPPAHESAPDNAQSSDSGEEPETAGDDSGTDTDSETAGPDDTNKAASATDEAWMDDTSVFTPGGRDAGQSYERVRRVAAARRGHLSVLWQPCRRVRRSAVRTGMSPSATVYCVDCTDSPSGYANTVTRRCPGAHRAGGATTWSRRQCPPLVAVQCSRCPQLSLRCGW